MGIALTSEQEVDGSPDDTEDSDTNPNTTGSSIVGEQTAADGRKRRSEATQLRRSVFGKKHDRLDESKVARSCPGDDDVKLEWFTESLHRNKTRFDDFDIC